jgi:hypothetical protein
MNNIEGGMSTLVNCADRKIAHDLKAQMINIKGFCEEIEKTAICLSSLNEKYATTCEGTEKIGQLLENDFFPCIKYLFLAANEMDRLIITVTQSNSAKEIY